MQLIAIDTFKQGFGYGVVGFMQLGIEWVIFVVLTAAGVPIAGANIFARAIAAEIGF